MFETDHRNQDEGINLTANNSVHVVFESASIHPESGPFCMRSYLFTGSVIGLFLASSTEQGLQEH